MTAEEQSVRERATQLSPRAIMFLAEVMAGQQNGATIGDRLKAAIAILEAAGILSPYYSEDD